MKITRIINSSQNKAALFVNYVFPKAIDTKAARAYNSTYKVHVYATTNKDIE